MAHSEAGSVVGKVESRWRDFFSAFDNAIAEARFHQASLLPCFVVRWLSCDLSTTCCGPLLMYGLGCPWLICRAELRFASINARNWLNSCSRRSWLTFLREAIS